MIREAGARAREVRAAWAALDRQLETLAEGGRPATVWWRDDDAAEPTEALDRLLDLRARLGMPLALAISPRLATDRLATRLRREGDDLAVLVHGIEHSNHAPTGEKSCELGFRGIEDLLAALTDGLGDLRARFGARVLPVLVPPWNRIDAALVPELSAIGYRGLSTFGPRAGAALHGLSIVNTHCDPIAWRQGRGLADEVDILTKLVRDLGREEPIGLLTHHLVHDDRIWHFTETLLSRLAVHPGIRWMRTDAVFAAAIPDEGTRA